MKFDVVCIGTATRDVFLKSGSLKTLHDPKHLGKIGLKSGEAECFPLGAKIEIEKPLLTVGGGAANAAVTFARQKFETVLVASVGNDEIGETIVKDLDKEGMTVCARVDKKTGSAYSTLLLSESGERTAFVYRGASESLEKKNIPKALLKARWLYLVPGRIPFPVIEHITKTAKKVGTNIAMNPSAYYLTTKKKELISILKYLDVVLVNREEAAMLTERDVKDESGIFKKFDTITPGIAVMTDGNRGACASDGKHVWKMGIFKEQALVDRTGAGDAFGSGFVSGLMRFGSIPEALRLASANAASGVESVGAQSGLLTKKEYETNKRWRYIEITAAPL